MHGLDVGATGWLREREWSRVWSTQEIPQSQYAADYFGARHGSRGGSRDGCWRVCLFAAKVMCRVSKAVVNKVRMHRHCHQSRRRAQLFLALPDFLSSIAHTARHSALLYCTVLYCTVHYSIFASNNLVRMRILTSSCVADLHSTHNQTTCLLCLPLIRNVLATPPMPPPSTPHLSHTPPLTQPRRDRQAEALEYPNCGELVPAVLPVARNASIYPKDPGLLCGIVLVIKSPVANLFDQMSRLPSFLPVACLGVEAPAEKVSSTATSRCSVTYRTYFL